MDKIKIIFFGTPEFAVPTLKKLIENHNFEILTVITAPDKPAGRKQILTPPPIKIITEKYKIPILQPEKIENCKLKIKDLRPDLIIICAFGKIIPKNILDIPKHGCLNVHPSLLPKYRGPSPIQWTILKGEKESGVTIILTDEKTDHGPILKSNIKNQISKITYKELGVKLAELGAKLLIKTVPQWINGEIKPIPQDDSKATYTKIIKKEDGKINWQKSAEEIERQIRAFYPWPGVYTKLNIKNQKSKILKIIKANVSKMDCDKKAGEFFSTADNKLAVACAKDALILERVQLEGKKEMSTEEFLRGHSFLFGNPKS